MAGIKPAARFLGSSAGQAGACDDAECHDRHGGWLGDQRQLAADFAAAVIRRVDVEVNARAFLGVQREEIYELRGKGRSVALGIVPYALYRAGNRVDDKIVEIIAQARTRVDLAEDNSTGHTKRLRVKVSSRD